MINSELKIFIKSYYIIESLIKEKVVIIFPENCDYKILGVMTKNDYEIDSNEAANIIVYYTTIKVTTFPIGTLYRQSYLQNLKFLLNT